MKKGDAMSPVFFNMTLENVIRKRSQTNTLHLDEGNILLEYADDNDHWEITTGYSDYCWRTKYMMVKWGGGDHNNLYVGNNAFE